MTNFIFGRGLFGRWIFAGPTGSREGSSDRGKVHEYYPGQFVVYAYKKDGTRTAIFGGGSEANALNEVTFEITSTGCGQCQLTFYRQPDNAQLDYMQRIDIHLYGDRKPWYSGYIISRPIEGTTDTKFVYKGYGFYNRLENVMIWKTYENTDVGDIVRDIARQVERQTLQVVYNDSKIQSVGYRPTKLVFDGVTVKEALNTLADFAVDYVYGVDEYRCLYFRRRETAVNEQARLTVGKHITSYTPSWDVSKLVNWARIKGGSVDDQGEQWLCVVEDKESQNSYGVHQAVWNLPEAYDAADAKRWGENQISQYKAPVKSAKISGVRLEYPYPDGTFNVRHMSTDGLAEIRRLDGNADTYPIKKIKYTLSGEKGIKTEMELGEPLFSVDRYLSEIERRSKDIEQSQSSALKQWKGGS